MITGAPETMKESAAVPLRNMAGLNRNISAAAVEIREKLLLRPARRSVPPASRASSALGMRKAKGENPVYLNKNDLTKSLHVSDEPEQRALIAPLFSANSDTKSGRCHKEAV